jgi:hypothetical protein
MVVDPDDADDEEAGHIGGVCRPFLRQRERKRLVQRVAQWHVQVQYKQGHGDGEDAVAERLRAACLAHRHRVILIVHVELYTGLGSATPTAAASADASSFRHSSGVKWPRPLMCCRRSTTFGAVSYVASNK